MVSICRIPWYPNENEKKKKNLSVLPRITSSPFIMSHGKNFKEKDLRKNEILYPTVSRTYQTVEVQ